MRPGRVKRTLRSLAVNVGFTDLNGKTYFALFAGDERVSAWQEVPDVFAEA